MNALTRLRTFAAALAVVLGASPLLAADASTTPAPKPTVPNMRPDPSRLLAAETRYWDRISDLIGSGDRQRLAQARLRFSLQQAFFADPNTDPFYDRTRHDVRNSYVSFYKEIARRELVGGIIDEGLRQRFGSPDVGGAHSPWGVRVDPRVSIGRSGYLGANLSLPRAPFGPLQDFSLVVRRDMFDHGTLVGLRYAKGNRFWQVEHISGDPTTGEQVDASVALRF